MANTIGFDPVAWAIDGGRIDGELMRVLSYAGTGGAEGIVTPGDVQVTALSTPGAQVAIGVGALVIRNSSPNVKNQSYVANARSQSLIDVPATTSAGGRSDLVVVRIKDPEYAPWSAPAPSEAPTFQYTEPFIITGVPASTKTAAELNLGYSAYALARIDRPASTGVVNPGHIVNLRKVANPRRQRRLVPVAFGDDATPQAVDTSLWTNWPAAATPFEIPSWATEVVARISVGGVWVDTGDIGMSVRASYSQFNGPLIASTGQLPIVERLNGAARFAFEVADQIPVPAADRGTTRYFYTQAARYPGDAGGNGRAIAGRGSRVVFDLEFIETAV